MTNNTYSLPRLTLTSPAAYVIRVRGQIGEKWTEYFDDFSAVASMPANRPPETILYGRVRDQTALLGMLHYLYYQGAVLVSVKCLGV